MGSELPRMEGTLLVQTTGRHGRKCVITECSRIKKIIWMTPLEFSYSPKLFSPASWIVAFFSDAHVGFITSCSTQCFRNLFYMSSFIYHGPNVFFVTEWFLRTKKASFERATWAHCVGLPSTRGSSWCGGRRWDTMEEQE